MAHEIQNKESDNDAVATRQTTLSLQERTTVDLAGLSDEQIAEIKTQHAKNQLDLQRRREEVKIDVEALDAMLISMNTQTHQASLQGQSMTVEHIQNSSVGRTEVIVGNTEKAAKGKISRSATGEPSQLPFIAIIAAVTAIVIALIVS